MTGKCRGLRHEQNWVPDIIKMPKNQKRNYIYIYLKMDKITSKPNIKYTLEKVDSHYSVN